MVRTLAVLALLCFGLPAMAAEELKPIMTPAVQADMQKRQDAEDAAKKECEAKGNVWGAVPPFHGCKTKQEVAQVKAQEADCKKSKGRWAADLYGTTKCLVDYNDANKPCQKNADCEGMCIVASQQAKDHGVCTPHEWFSDVLPVLFDKNDKFFWGDKVTNNTGAGAN